MFGVDGMGKTASIIAVLLSVSLGGSIPVLAATAGSYDHLKQETETKLKTKLLPLLEKYCNEACQIIGIDVEVDEEIPDGNDMGFESSVPGESGGRLFVSKVEAEIQIDDRVTSINRDRLENILVNHLRTFGMTSHIKWHSVQLPRIGRSGEVEQQMRERLESRLNQTLTRVIDQYCPDQCIIEKIEINAAMISPDEATSLRSTQKVIDESGRTVMRLDNIEVDVSMDEGLAEAARSRITNLMRTRTKFVEPVALNVSISSFPESYARVREKQKQEENDPYGLEKLRQMLIMFRELAGTKEIITNNKSESLQKSDAASSTSQISREMSSAESKSLEKVAQSSSTKSETATSNSLKESSQQKSSVASVQDSMLGLSSEETMVYGAIAILFLALVGLGIFKFVRANRSANEMMMRTSNESVGGAHGQAGGMGWSQGAGGGETSAGTKGPVRNDASLRLRVQDLKDELINLFMENPKVAKDTFGRMIKEDGVEETAKYVKLFGHMVVFELLDDPNMQRDLYQLSEYFHNSDFKFTLEEELNLLVKLKTRCTAAEIRVLTTKGTEKFEFLKKLDPGQIYKLITDEKVQVQSIVLSQLDRKRRMALFEMYTGQSKVDLMAELSMAEAIPKEYMFNVAKSLKRKVQERPEFDVENLRSSDILLDLLEKADLREQRQLMLSLQVQNPDTARALKQKLVTVEMLPALKDGHLLEIILGMQREDLLAFLAGGRDHIRNLLLRKAPSELADSWVEDLETLARVDEQTFRIAEMKVLNRIRALANSGVISLMDINDMIFAQGMSETEVAEGRPRNLSPASMVA